MGLFGWLSRKQQPRHGSGYQWGVSENGNATLILDRSRITVFPQDRGWKYCIADVEDREEPYFSEAYATEQAAREEALADLNGESSRHRPMSIDLAVAHREKWETLIIERERLIEELRTHLAAEPDLGLSALRKPEAKIASHLKQLSWQINQYRIDLVSNQMVAMAERQQAALTQLADEIARRIAAKEVERRPRKPPVSASTLSTDLAAKIDKLIQMFADTPVMSNDERSRRRNDFTRRISARMFDEGVTYGEAAGIPEWLRQDEVAFREFMKKADQDLSWQCDTVALAFDHYLQSGEIPAPHYPMRIAVLLSKAKDFDRERHFLAAWCKHFPSGNGVTYAALVDRAKKAGAIAAS